MDVAETSPAPMSCGASTARCVCTLPAGHDDAHVCDPEVCGGSWRGSEADGTFEVVLYPGGFDSPGAALVYALGMWLGDDDDLPESDDA